MLSGESKGYGLVKYVSSDAAAQAKHLLDGRNVLNHVIDCDWLNSAHMSLKSLHSKALYIDQLPPNYRYVRRSCSFGTSRCSMCSTMFHYVTLFPIMFHHVPLCFTMFLHVALCPFCSIMLHHVPPFFTMSHYVLICSTSHGTFSRLYRMIGTSILKRSTSVPPVFHVDWPPFAFFPSYVPHVP